MAPAMSIAKRTFIIVGVLASSAVVTFLVAGCLIFGREKVSSGPIPGSSMTAVVTADVSGCYSVQLFEHGHPISDLQLLGPYASQKCTLDKVTSVSNIVTIDWSDGYHYSVAVDVNAHRFVNYSNGVPVQ
jgi:hypothetical protein